MALLRRRPLRPRRLRVLTQACAGTIVLAVAMRTARRREVGEAEEGIFARINELPEPFTAPLYVLMQAGQFGAIPATAALAWRSGRPELARTLATAGTASWVLARVVKRLTRRARPDAYLDGVIVRGKEWTGLGFPSGHSAVATSLVAVLAPHLSTPLRESAWGLVTVVAVSRVYVGAHLPLDTIGGIVLGGVVGRLTTLALDATDDRPSPATGRK